MDCFSFQKLKVLELACNFTAVAIVPLNAKTIPALGCLEHLTCSRMGKPFDLISNPKCPTQ